MINACYYKAFKIACVHFGMQIMCITFSGTPELRGQEEQPGAGPVALHQEEQGGQLKVPFQFKGRNSELSEMSMQFFYEFASVQNARNAVIELQE